MEVARDAICKRAIRPETTAQQRLDEEVVAGYMEERYPFALYLREFGAELIEEA